MTLTKADYIEQMYYEAAWFYHVPSEDCYALAVEAAHELGGIEVANINDGNSSKSFAPTRTFEFDDTSKVQITYENVFIVLGNELY